MAKTTRFHVFFFADGSKLISEEPITKAMARRAHGFKAEPVRAMNWSPMLRLAIASARDAGKFPPALPA